nr:SMI1/KNR4 family protein [Marinobacter sp. C7]
MVPFAGALAPVTSALTIMIRLLGIILFGLLLMACNPADNSYSLIGEVDLKNASDAADIAELRAALETIEGHHQGNETGIQLNQGAKPEDIAQLERELQCKIPQELLEIWKWHNGESTSNFIWYHRFLSVEEALAEYRELTTQEWSLWEPDWVPVFEFEGEWYGVKCDEDRKIASPVVFHFIEDEPHIAYLNLTRYMKTMAIALEQGALSWGGIAWEEDPYRLDDIFSELNPGLAFPYFVPEKR